MKDDDHIGYKRLANAIVVRAIKDYYRGTIREDNVKPPSHIIIEKGRVREWVKKIDGTFDLCAMAMNKEPEQLQEMMLEKMEQIDKGMKLRKEVLKYD